MWCLRLGTWLQSSVLHLSSASGCSYRYMYNRRPIPARPWFRFLAFATGSLVCPDQRLHLQEAWKRRLSGLFIEYCRCRWCLFDFLHMKNLESSCSDHHQLIKAAWLWLIGTRTGRYRARRQSGFPTFIPCQRQDANVLPKRRQSHQGDKLCDVSTVPLVARWPVFLARGSDADGGPHYCAG